MNMTTMMNMKTRMKTSMKMTKKWLLLLLIIPVAVFAIGYYQRTVQAKKEVATSVTSGLVEYSLEELAKYDGTDPQKPIYIGMNGLVYDVTAGRNYYEPNGSYHFLAGKDSSEQLNLIGGDIIKRKYPVIGKLSL